MIVFESKQGLYHLWMLLLLCMND